MVNCSRTMFSSQIHKITRITPFSGVLQSLSSDVRRQAIPSSKSFGEVKELELGGYGGVGFGLASTGS